MCASIFAEIGKDIDTIYRYLHPGEDVGDVALEVKDSTAGSALIKARFCEREDIDPRGYFSESHLDTLAISVFLALRYREQKLNPHMGLIVLDDVIMSVDAPHRKRLAEYLLTEVCKRHQVIITTHNRAGFEWLKYLQRVYGCTQEFDTARYSRGR